MTPAHRSPSARTATLAALAALAALASCDSPPSCEKAVAHAGAIRGLSQLDIDHSRLRCKQEGWSGALRECIVSAKDEAGLTRCAAGNRPRDPAGAFGDYMTKSKQSEAQLNLHVLERRLKEHYYEYAAFPEGEAGPTPPVGTCCEQAGGKCQPDPAAWQVETLWGGLDFSVDHPHYFSYRIRSQGSQVTAEAIGDLDCDGVTSSFTLTCKAVDGTPTCEVERPRRQD